MGGLEVEVEVPLWPTEVEVSSEVAVVEAEVSMVGQVSLDNNQSRVQGQNLTAACVAVTSTLQWMGVQK